MPLVSVLAEMEMTGILLDLPFFKKMSEELTKRMAEIEKQVFESGRQTVQPQLDPAAFGCALQHICGLSRPTKARKPPADITPHLPMCLNCCAANIPWWI